MTMQEAGATTGEKTAVLIVAKPAGNIPRMVNLAENLREAGVRVIQIGREKRDDEDHNAPNVDGELLNISLSADRLHPDVFRQPLLICEFIVRVVRLLNSLKPDYIFTFYNTAAIFHRFRFRFPTRKIAWLLDFQHPFFQRGRHRVLERLGEMGWEHADAIVVPTRERLALHLARRPQCLHVPAFVVPNSPNRGKAEDGGIPPNFAPGPIRLIYAGSVGTNYGLEALIRAVDQRRSETHLRIVGRKRYIDGDRRVLVRYQQPIQRLLDRLRHPKNVEWLDAVPYSKLPALLRQAHVGYVTYDGRSNLNDRFSAPGKAYDYLREGLVLLTDHESPVAEDLQTAGCGVVFQAPATSEKLRSAIDVLIECKDTLPQMRERARALFDSNYNQARCLRPLFRYLGVSE